MKKLVVIGLTILVSLLLFGCGGDDPVTPPAQITDEFLSLGSKKRPIEAPYSVPFTDIVKTPIKVTIPEGDELFIGYDKAPNYESSYPFKNGDIIEADILINYIKDKSGKITLYVLHRKAGEMIPEQQAVQYHYLFNIEDLTSSVYIIGGEDLINNEDISSKELFGKKLGLKTDFLPEYKPTLSCTFRINDSIKNDTLSTEIDLTTYLSRTDGDLLTVKLITTIGKLEYERNLTYNIAK